MAEGEKTRIRERPPIPDSNYECFLRNREEFVARQLGGPVVIKPTDRQLEVTRQGRLLYYLAPWLFKEPPLQEWQLFKLDIRTHSGRHRHQGGLVIYVINGKGYSIVNGERIDWQKGDLLLLPIKPDGVEHQHFNSVPGETCQWVAFVHMGIMDHLAMDAQQVEVSPDFQQQN